MDFLEGVVCALDSCDENFTVLFVRLSAVSAYETDLGLSKGGFLAHRSHQGTKMRQKSVHPEIAG